LKLRQVLPDRFSQIMALFLASYALFLLLPAFENGYEFWIGFEASGWVSALVIVFGLLCVGLHFGLRYQKYWMVLKLVLMLLFFYASELIALSIIELTRRGGYLIRYELPFELDYTYGIAFYWVSLPFFFIFLFLKPAFAPENRVAPGDQDAAHGSSIGPGNEGRR